MRTVSFSDEHVQRRLNEDFVCCNTNTKGDPSAGASFSHAPDDQPGPCGRGAGRQNVQAIFLTPSGGIFHVATGYLSPKELLEEMDFAKGLFDRLERSPRSAKQTVVAAHQQRLKELGFTPQQIASRDDSPLSEFRLTGPNPQDFGIDVPTPGDLGINLGPAGDVFGDISRQRILKDHQYVMAHPLISHEDFSADPGALVGRHRSFFGSNSAMNGIGDQVNDAFKQRFQRSR